ncbi:PREDICTED: uncharacterized protein C10orf62 homolog [Dipodomys ordii]|uniref:Uncharacterized protein C10orf62 homolog n=1 Tax=Dipodomys ordii TaxID=10020 RepID=A0A1S3FAK9_DIPOR|nr:PREDICTED: uncharacterized protein C10orf62 homolog [Dipodomys ordii]
MLWAQRKRKRKTASDPTQDGYSDYHNPNESWIKSHFSRLSEEKLRPEHYAPTNAGNTSLQPESGCGEASTNIRMETFTSSRHGEGNPTLHRDSFHSKQKICGPLVTKETHKESGGSTSTDEATWAAVAACAKEIDAKGHHLANSMLQRAPGNQHSSHIETRSINPEELKALEEVEIKLKGDFLTQRESSLAGANHTHTFYSQGRHGHQSALGHTGHQSLLGHPVYSGHQNHPGYLIHQALPGHSSHQGHSGHSSHQGHSGYVSHPGHPSHHSHQSHSLPGRSH